MPNNLTDAEVKKALECCIKSSHFGECFENECPLVSEKGCKVGKETLYPYALDLINRLETENEKNENIIRIADKTIATLNAENENLIAEIERLWLCIDELKKLVGKHEPNYDPSEEVDTIVQRITILDTPSLQAKIKAEAYKECLEKIEQRDVSESDFYIMVKKTEFDNLLNELVNNNQK